MPTVGEKPVLYLPVKPCKINQVFGDNLACVKNLNQPNQSIVSGTDNNTCPPGYSKLYAAFGMKGHDGIDIQAGVQNIFAAMDGTVIEMQTDARLGLGLGIVSLKPLDLGSNGIHYLKIRYWHLKSFNVSIGQSVKAGDWIGISNNTGYSGGNHLHFEGDPMDKMSNGKYSTCFPNNGYSGGIDLQPYFSTIFAQDLALNNATSDIQQLQTVLNNHPNPMQLDLVHQALEVIRQLLSSL